MWRGMPYQAQPSHLPLTHPLDMHLATEHRAVERSEFDRAMDEKIRQQEVRAGCSSGVMSCKEASTVLLLLYWPGIEHKAGAYVQQAMQPSTATKSRTRSLAPVNVLQTIAGFERRE